MHIYLQNVIFWLFRAVIVFVPVFFSYLAILFNIGRTGRKTMLELLCSGQICFIAFSISASSLANILAAWCRRMPTLFEIAVFLILLLASFSSILFYYLFNDMFEYKGVQSESYENEREKCRNIGIFIILGVVMLFSFVADVIFMG